MEDGPRSCIRDYEWRDKAVTYPDADPRLPPGETELDHRRYDHPSAQASQSVIAVRGGKAEVGIRVDVKTVRYPTVGEVMLVRSSHSKGHGLTMQ